MNFANLLAAVGPLLSSGPNYREAASKQAQKDKAYRFVVNGHTHEPLFEPLLLAGDRPSFHVNTGCWRRVVTRVKGDAGSPFVARRLASYFQIDEADGTARQERYHLYQEWHAN
jgi:hypothetical protein